MNLKIRKILASKKKIIVFFALLFFVVTIVIVRSINKRIFLKIEDNEAILIKDITSKEAEEKVKSSKGEQDKNIPQERVTQNEKKQKQENRSNKEKESALNKQNSRLNKSKSDITLGSWNKEYKNECLVLK